jgi:cytosine/adenosine deaminase-related metal-dependent hydrolase
MPHSLRHGASFLFLLASPLAAQTTAFVDVTVIPMERSGEVLRGQTVVVRAGRIAAVGPAASTDVPADATRVDGQGRFLIPGLAEMHGHIPAVNPDASNPNWSADVLFLYVAAGATTVRGMQGNPTHIPLRERVRSGDIIGPRLYLSGPAMSGNSVPDAATAERLVREYHAAGYDHLKVHEGLSVEAYDAIARTASSLGMRWGGHVSQFIGVDGALAAHQATIDHIDDYIESAQRDGSPALSLEGWARISALPLNVDESKIPDLVRRTRDAGVAIVPTHALWETLRGAHAPEEFLDWPELRWVPQQMVEQWTSSARGAQGNNPPASAAAEVAFRNHMLKALSDGGVTILMGTDAPQVFSVPGFSLHREVVAMRDAGMDSWQILHSGTKAVAEHFGTLAETGTVAAGKRADLVLLGADPVADIANIRRIDGVMVSGRWLPAADIATELEAIARRNGR